MFGEYDIGKVISAVVTLLIIGIVIRLYLNYVKSKRPNLQKPDWLKERENRKRQN